MVVVHSNGALVVEPRGPLSMHSSQWTHFDGHGRYRNDDPRLSNEALPKQQGSGRRWSYLPWTEEQEDTCKARLVVKLKVGAGAKAKEKRLLRILMDKETSKS